MPQKKLEEWISPQEASLIMSIRRGVYISPDDIKQLKNHNRFPDGGYIRVSERHTIYQRKMIENFDGLQKRISKDIDINTVVSWLWEFPKTIAHLEKQGCSIPNKEQALALVPEIEAKQANPKKKQPNPVK